MRTTTRRPRFRFRLPGGLHYTLGVAALMLLSTAFAMAHGQSDGLNDGVSYASAEQAKRFPALA